MYASDYYKYRTKDTTDPIWYSLNKVNYRLYITFTFFYESQKEESQKGNIIRTEILKRFFYIFRAYFKMNKKELEMFYCFEKNLNDEYHVHCIISNKGIERYSFIFLYNFIVNIWNRVCNAPFSIIDIKEVDNHTKRDLVRYIAKRKKNFKFGIEDKNYYISDGLLSALKRLAS